MEFREDLPPYTEVIRQPPEGASTNQQEIGISLLFDDIPEEIRSESLLIAQIRAQIRARERERIESNNNFARSAGPEQTALPLKGSASDVPDSTAESSSRAGMSDQNIPTGTESARDATSPRQSNTEQGTNIEQERGQSEIQPPHRTSSLGRLEKEVRSILLTDEGRHQETERSELKYKAINEFNQARKDAQTLASDFDQHYNWWHRLWQHDTNYLHSIKQEANKNSSDDILDNNITKLNKLSRENEERLHNFIHNTDPQKQKLQEVIDTLKDAQETMRQAIDIRSSFNARAYAKEIREFTILMENRLKSFNRISERCSDQTKSHQKEIDKVYSIIAPPPYQATPQVEPSSSNTKWDRFKNRFRKP